MSGDHIFPPSVCSVSREDSGNNQKQKGRHKGRELGLGREEEEVIKVRELKP